MESVVASTITTVGVQSGSFHRAVASEDNG